MALEKSILDIQHTRMQILQQLNTLEAKEKELQKSLLALTNRINPQEQKVSNAFPPLPARKRDRTDSPPNGPPKKHRDRLIVDSPPTISGKKKTACNNCGGPNGPPT